jgi:hypothetical protein
MFAFVPIVTALAINGLPRWRTPAGGSGGPDTQPR